MAKYNKIKEQKVNLLASPKYRDFTDYLRRSNKKELTLSFKEIEKILGFDLPPCARRNRANWSNTLTISLCRSWMAAGYWVDSVSIPLELVTFRKVED